MKTLSGYLIFVVCLSILLIILYCADNFYFKHAFNIYIKTQKVNEENRGFIPFNRKTAISYMTECPFISPFNPYALMMIDMIFNEFCDI